MLTLAYLVILLRLGQRIVEKLQKLTHLPITLGRKEERREEERKDACHCARSEEKSPYVNSMI